MSGILQRLAIVNLYLQPEGGCRKRAGVDPAAHGCGYCARNAYDISNILLKGVCLESRPVSGCQYPRCIFTGDPHQKEGGPALHTTPTTGCRQFLHSRLLGQVPLLAGGHAGPCRSGRTGSAHTSTPLPRVPWQVAAALAAPLGVPATAKIHSNPQRPGQQHEWQSIGRVTAHDKCGGRGSIYSGDHTQHKHAGRFLLTCSRSCIACASQFTSTLPSSLPSFCHRYCTCLAEQHNKAIGTNVLDGQ